MSGPFKDIGDLPEIVTWRGAVVLAKDAQGRYLMQLRDDRPDIAEPGLWSLFGGGVEPGESMAQAAAREFLEETGIALDIATLTPLARFASEALRGGVIHVFSTSQVIDPCLVRLGEGAGFACLTRAQIDRFGVITNMQRLLREMPQI